MKKAVIVYVLLFLSSCSLIFSNDFIDLGPELKRFPRAIQGNWIRTGFTTSSFIERFSVKKSSFSIKLSGSDAENDDEISLSDSVRVTALQPFYVVQLKTEKGILLTFLSCSGDTIRLFEPNLSEMESAFNQVHATGNLGVPMIFLEEEAIRKTLADPDNYLLPGDVFIRQRAKMNHKR